MRIDLGTKFQLRLTILIFWANLPKKGVSGLKRNIHMSMVVSNYIELFCTGADRHNGICNKTRQRRVRRLLMRVNSRRRVRRVRCVLMMGKARRRTGAQARKVQINNG